ncbi:MAG: hypothetical protein JNL41_07125 [Phenylobacterium sp.]|uniref:hypothetical protein n=1 Tax=Phenylobacterium sp. TaxID=1871053 RepID=UPI001A52FFDF|nr:hypothetical protein [Phenylobacterium sp.]MBL8554033.1 hypothetical protein [Phenylobacterium sp.]
MRVSPSSDAAAVAPFPDRPHLRNSRPLSWDRAPATPAARAALAELLVQMEAWEPRRRARRADDRARLEATLGAIALDLFAAAGEDAERWLAYSRRNADYEALQRRYVHPEATRTTVEAVVGFLEAGSYAETRAGSYRRQALGGGGYRSRLRATDRLVAYFAGRGIGLDDIGVREAAELVVLKGPAATRGGTKPLLGYDDTGETCRMREELRAWSAVAQRHDIRPGGDRWDPMTRPLEDADEGAGEAVELHRARLYRVFNNGSWRAGGRFYGGWWMTMPSADRKRLTIDGEPVVELDFKALHPRMAYHLAGWPLDLEDDPYDLGGAWAPVDRGAVKVAFNQLLAVGPGAGIRRPADLVLPRGRSYGDLLAALEAKHEAIRPWLRSARALELQNLDSRIAAGVLAYFTARGRPVLPVHDSFVVAARDEYKLGETMFLAYRAVLSDRGGVAAWPVVKGWSGTGVEERVRGVLC